MDTTQRVALEISRLGIEVLENEPMCNHTSFEIGGPADIFVAPKSKEAFTALLKLLYQYDYPYMVVGKGSNLLVSDQGIAGAVIKTESGLADIRCVLPTSIVCGAGVPLSRLCAFAKAHSLAGLEFAFGIPGSAGGAAYMNAGAYDGQMSDVLVRCHHIDRQGKEGTFERDALDFSYRHSVYAGNGFAITGIEVELAAGDPTKIKAKMKDLMGRRKTKQPLEYPSAGSVFKRPPGQFAGTLIEKAGLKGHRVGGAMVSKKHAGFIINAGGASCADVLQLIAHIQKTVFSQFGIQLECEIKMIGKQ